MTNPSPDWLDDVLRPRPVDDEGFTARVAGLGRSEVRTGWIVRLAIAVVVVGGLAACGGAEWLILGVMFGADDDARAVSVDGRAWVDEQRAGWTRVVATFDANPALRRRGGRDASAVLNDVIRRARFDNATHANSFSCAKEAAQLLTNREDVASRGVCDTSWIAGLAGYDEWKTRPDDDDESFWQPLLTMARVHLRRAAAAPLVPGAPAPFAVAARDVEALGRLAMNHNGAGARFFGVVASEHERAAALGRAGDHVVVVDEDGAALLQRAWFAGIAFSAPGATDDDVAAVGRMQSVLACGALSDAFDTHALGARFLDERRIARVRALDRAGCAPPVERSLQELACFDLPRSQCRLLLAPTSLPLFRQRVVDGLERWRWTKLRLDATTPTPTASTTARAASSEQP